MKKILLFTMAFFIMLAVLCCQPVSLYAGESEIEVYSESMNRSLPVSVVLPERYHHNNDLYPVIYLLHGAMGDHRSWLDEEPVKGLVQRLADQYNIIFVMPSGDNFSFYFDSPWNTDSQFEYHITREVIPTIDKKYRTLNDRGGRAVTGLSMGGHGALYLSARNPELFCVAGSMSGAVDLDVQNWDLPEESIAFFTESITQGLGHDQPVDDFLAGHSVSNMVDRLKENQLPLIIDCGIDDFLLDANRLLNKRLLESGVPHDYIERPGRHDWEYWANALLYQALFISEVFGKQYP